VLHPPLPLLLFWFSFYYFIVIINIIITKKNQIKGKREIRTVARFCPFVFNFSETFFKTSFPLNTQSKGEQLFRPLTNFSSQAKLSSSHRKSFIGPITQQFSL
jgi:hypothetical protein